MTAQLIAPPLSPDDYRTLEERSETRHEYCNGERIPTIGGSYRHSQIITNFVVLLATALADTDQKKRVQAPPF